MDKRLSERKQKILKAVVDEYIISASPISSGEIKTKHFEDISSATIRSELSTLEDMGYLLKPHTSAGRIPSKSAYEMYANNFLEKYELSSDEVAFIQKSFDKKFTAIEEIVKSSAKVISDITNYTSVIVMKNINNVKIKEVKLVDLDDHSALVIIITDSGIIRDKIITVSRKLDDSYLNESSLIINKMFTGRSVSELKGKHEKLEDEMRQYKEVYEKVFEILHSYTFSDQKNVIVEGRSKLLSHPDTDMKQAKEFLEAMDNNDEMTELIEGKNNFEFSVRIGKDDSGGIEKCAVITSKVTLNGKEICHAGVIGPERMNYNKVMGVLRYIGKALDNIMDIDGGNDDKKRL